MGFNLEEMAAGMGIDAEAVKNAAASGDITGAINSISGAFADKGIDINELMSKIDMDAVKEMAKNLAMQVAALNPAYTDRSEVSEEYIAHQEEILRAQIANDPKESSKPEKVIEGMVKGRLNKELKEVCLLDQVYVKAEDGKQSVVKYLEQVSKEIGTTLKIAEFVRFETGEGIEKKEENFAEEVAKQMNM